MKFFLLSIICNCILVTENCCAKNTDITLQMLQNKKWHLIQLDNRKTDISASLKIDDKTHASGSTGCNLFFGQAKLKKNSLCIEKMGMTKMACMDDDLMEKENIIMNVLSGCGSINLKGDRMILKNKMHMLVYVLIHTNGYT